MSNPATESKSNAAGMDDPGALVFEIDQTLEFSKRGGGTQTHYVAHDPRLGSYFRLGVAEYHVVCLFDGKRDLQNVYRQLNHDGVNWSLEELLRFVKELAKHRIARVVAAEESGPSEPAERDPTNNASRPAWQSLLRLAGSTLSQRLPVADGDRVANRLLPCLGWVFSVAATVVFSVFIFSGLLTVWGSGTQFAAEVQRIFDQPLWMFGAIWIGLKIVHECGHAVCAKFHGVRVGPMGVLFFLLAPLAYVDVTDAWKLARRRDRVQIALAGVYLELIIGATAAWVWWLSPVGAVKHFAAQVFLVAGPATLIVNANPLLRLDGYYILSDLLEIPNLRQHGRERLLRIIESRVFLIPGTQNKLQGWRSDFALLHAVGSVLFQVVWMTGLIVAVGRWLKGAGILLAAVALTLWFFIPLMRWMHKVWTHQRPTGWLPSKPQRRLLATSAFIVMAFHHIAVSSSPFARRVPVVVRYQNEQIARAPADAFVETVVVDCGERVKRGRLLVLLSQPELQVKYERLIDQRDIELSKANQLRRKGEIALATAASENAASLDRRLEEVATQIDALRIVATRDGIVSTPRPMALTGQYLKSGDEVIRVSDPHEKELLAVVGESDVDAFRAAVGDGAMAQVRLRGGVSIDTVLQPLQPSASRVLPHDALAATAGGPLALEPDPGSSESRLVQAQLQSIVTLDALRSLKVQAGQVGRLRIPDSRSLISRVWEDLQPTDQ